MRLVMVTTPGLSHLLPLVPFARAAESAGHEVLAVVSGPANEGAKRSGLTTYDPAPGADVAAPYYELARRAVAEQLDPELTLEALFAAFGQINNYLLEGLRYAVANWEGEAVVYPPMAPIGRLVARENGIRSIFHQVGLRHPEFSIAGMDGGCPDFEVSISPFRLDADAGNGPVEEPTSRLFRMAPRCFNGGGSIPAWALSRREKPRVLATLGSVHQSVDNGELYEAIIESTKSAGLELVLTTGGAELEELPSPLPSHVRVVDWIPLGRILPSCEAIIHHGGAGTNHSAFVQGTPQVLIPTTNGDALTNARLTQNIGCGVWTEPVAFDQTWLDTAISHVLNDRQVAEACCAVRQEFEILTDPAAVVDEIASALT